MLPFIFFRKKVRNRLHKSKTFRNFAAKYILSRKSNIYITSFINFKNTTIMMKTLRYFFVAALAMVSFNAMAEDIIWAEDFSTYKADDVPDGGTYGYACENGGGTTKIFEQALAGGVSPELLVAKKGGSFTAVVPLGGKSGEMSIAYKTNRAELTLEVTGATVGEKVRSGNTDTYALTVAGGTESLTIKISMPTSVTSNARLDDIKLYQGTAKKPAGLSWGKASTTVTYGDTESYTKYLPTLQNSNNLSITCTTTDPAVATVTNEGVITVTGPGECVLAAIFEGNDEYEAQTVNFTLTVKPAPSTETVWDFTVLPTQTIDGTGNMEGNVTVFTEDEGAGWQQAYNKAEFPDATEFMATATDVFTPFKGLKWTAMANNKMVFYRNYPDKEGQRYGGKHLAFNKEAEFMLPAKAGQKIEMVVASSKSGGTTKKIKSPDVVEVFDETEHGLKIEFTTAYEYQTVTLTAAVDNPYLTFESTFCVQKITVKDATGIAAVKAANKVASTQMYNLAGQKVGKDYKGIVIVNGKKMLNK